MSAGAGRSKGSFEGGQAHIGVEPEEQADARDNLDAGAVGREIVLHRAEPKPTLCVGSAVIGLVEGFLRFGIEKMRQRARPDVESADSAMAGDDRLVTATDRKARVLRALRREPVDRLPVQTNYTAKMGQILAEHFGVPIEGLPDRLDNHLLRVDISHSRPVNEDGTIEFDWWGAGWDTRTEGYWHSFAPLKESYDLDRIIWPDPEAAGLLDEAQRTIAARGAKYFVAPNIGTCLFERAWSLRGFDALLMDMVDRPEWVEELLDRIAAIEIALAKRFVATGVDGGYFGDDYGAQRSMLFSPRLWRRLIKPRLAAMFAVFLDAGLPVILHSDGDIRAILPDLVEIGLTTLNPVQPEVLEHAWLHREYGSKLSFYGGISTQGVLPTGNAETIRAATIACARELAPEGTGLLLGPSHRMQSDIPPRSVDAMLEAFNAA